MVTSVWLMSLSLGAFLGSLIGGYLYDIIGFSWLCSVEGISVGLTVSRNYIYFFLILLEQNIVCGSI